jgi:DNA polymerase-3 subunit delta'
MARKPSPKPPRETVVRAPEPPPVQAPIALSSVLGQDRGVSILTSAIASARVHHAWIFEGPLGVGKFTAALAFAAMILDETTQPGLSGGLAPDPDSRVQRLLRAGTHPDLAVITKELARFHEDKEIRDRKQSSIPVEVVRQFMLEPGRLAPQIPGASIAGRVFIVDEAEMLGPPAQNALLKFLEEPPPRTVLILVTSNPSQLLMTIRSRCQRVAFGLLPPKAMRQWLSEHKDLAIDDRQRDFLLDFCAGAPGGVLQAHATGIGAWWERLQPLLAQAEGGRHSVELGPAMSELVDAWAKAWVEARDDASKEAANRLGAEWMLRLLAWHARQRVTQAMGRAPASHLERAMHAIDLIREAEAALDANVAMLFVFDRLSAMLAAGPEGERHAMHAGPAGTGSRA